MLDRLKRLGLTFIAKKYLAWVVSCVFLWFGKVNGTDWVMFTAAIFAIDAYTKKNIPTAP